MEKKLYSKPQAEVVVLEANLGLMESETTSIVPLPDPVPARRDPQLF